MYSSKKDWQKAYHVPGPVVGYEGATVNKTVEVLALTILQRNLLCKHFTWDLLLLSFHRHSLNWCPCLSDLKPIYTLLLKYFLGLQNQVDPPMQNYLWCNLGFPLASVLVIYCCVTNYHQNLAAEKNTDYLTEQRTDVARWSGSGSPVGFQSRCLLGWRICFQGGSHTWLAN